MITATNKYRDFIDSLEKKIAHLSGNRSMNTPKRRKQASSARCERMNLEAARDACQQMAYATERGDLPNDLQQTFKSMKSICDATELKVGSGTGYYSEYYLEDEHRENGQAAKSLRSWLKRGESTETDAEKLERGRKFLLEQKLSELRGARIEGFFPTPNEIILNYMTHDISFGGNLVLEPSAGIGSICDEVKRRGGEVVAVERQSSLVEVLTLKGHQVIHSDFLELEPIEMFDYVLMNPPFESNQSPVHFLHAWKFLKPGGLIRAIMPAMATRYAESRTKALQAFAEWVEDEHHWWTALPDGAFKNSFCPTGVNCVVLTMKKGE